MNKKTKFSAKEFTSLQKKGDITLDKKGRLRTKKEKVKSEKKKPTYNGITFDSSGEMYIYWWLLELEEKGYIRDIITQPESFVLSRPFKHRYTKQLKTKTKSVEQTLLPGNIYTSDFRFTTTIMGLGSGMFTKLKYGIKLTPNTLIADDRQNHVYLEAKPDDYSMKTFDGNNMVRLFRNKQKQVYDKHGTYINLVFTNKLFFNTFTPAKYLFTDSGKELRKIKYKTKSLDNYIKELQSQVKLQGSLNL